MRTLTIRLVGTSPLLLHRVCRHEFRDTLAARASADVSFENEARENMVTDAAGNPAVPSAWLADALSRVHTKVKVPFFTLPDCLLPLQASRNGSLHMSVYRSVQHAAPGSRRSILVVAPQFKEWRISLSVQVDEDFPDETLLRVLREAGRAGIGLFHPPKKQFGQFRCVLFRRSV